MKLGNGTHRLGGNQFHLVPHQVNGAPWNMRKNISFHLFNAHNIISLSCHKLQYYWGTGDPAVWIIRKWTWSWIKKWTHLLIPLCQRNFCVLKKKSRKFHITKDMQMITNELQGCIHGFFEADAYLFDKNTILNKLFLYFLTSKKGDQNDFRKRIYMDGILFPKLCLYFAICMWSPRHPERITKTHKKCLLRTSF